MNLLNEGSASLDRSEGKSATASVASSEGSKLNPASQQSDSQDPVPKNGNTKASQLSGLPTLEAADDSKPWARGAGKKHGAGVETEEDGGGYALVKKRGEYNYVDKAAGNERAEDGAGYAYATVGGGMGARAAQPGNGGEEGKENREKGAGLPPYGKVTRHMVPVSKRSGYSEVLTSSPMLHVGRPRAVTEPIDPAHADDGPKQQGQLLGRGLRDERAFTESAAHLPLPQIPNFEVSEDTYDSIPDELRASAGASSASASGAGAKPTSAGAAAKPKSVPLRESLYESVEVDEVEQVEGDEDMYESVPEDMKPSLGSPDTLSPISPFPPPPISPSITRTKTEVPGISKTPPASPTVKERDEEEVKKRGKDHGTGKGELKKHKVLSKAKSDTVTEARGRSLSSLFGRKKTGGPNSNTPPSPKPKNKKEKIQHEPLPKVPTVGSVPSPTHLPPSPPPMPAPPPPDEDEEEDDPSDSAYDMIEVINPQAAALLRNSTAKAKSASLPASMRSSGAIALYGHGPLPDLPEESAGGLVSRERVPEDMDPEYDTVVLGQLQNDPSYDSVEVGHIGEVDAMPKLEPAEPPGSPGAATGGAAAAADGGEQQTQANKYARVSSHAAVDNSATYPPDLTAVAPDHDELGYAVIPAHMKMRKRAQSDAMMRTNERDKKDQPKSVDIDDPEYDNIHTATDANAETSEPSEMDESEPPMEPEYESVTDAMTSAEMGSPDKKETPYASVDMAAKRRSQMLRQQSGATAMNTLESEGLAREPSPNPPPLPQQGDLGDLSEFKQPPVPQQAEASLMLIDPSGSNTVNPYSQIDLLPPDHPYASVKKKTEWTDAVEESKAEGEEENPYSTVVDNIDGILSPPAPSDPPYANIQKGRVVRDREAKDPGPGYSKAGSKCLSGGGGESATVVENVNGAHKLENGEEEEEDTYDRLDHGFGNAGTCRANPALSAPTGDGEYATVTVDFSTSPELVVTHTDSVQHEANGVVRQVEETTINFTE